MKKFKLPGKYLQWAPAANVQNNACVYFQTRTYDFWPCAFKKKYSLKIWTLLTERIILVCKAKPTRDPHSYPARQAIKNEEETDNDEPTAAGFRLVFRRSVQNR